MAGWLRTRLGLGFLSIAGTTAGHYLSYWFVAPDPHHRDELMDATGHAGESPFLILALAALFATFISILGGRPRTTAPALIPTFVRLAPMQIVAFGMLESTERLLEGTALADAAREPVVWLGVVAQVVVAAAGAVLLRLLHRAASVVAPIPPTFHVYEICAAVDGSTVLSSHYAGRPWHARGPPVHS